MKGRIFPYVAAGLVYALSLSGSVKNNLGLNHFKQDNVAFKENEVKDSIKINRNSDYKLSREDYESLFGDGKKEKCGLEDYFSNFASFFSVNFVTNKENNIVPEYTCGSGFYLNKEGLLLTSSRLIQPNSEGLFALSFTESGGQMLKSLEVVARYSKAGLVLCKTEDEENLEGINVPNLRKNRIVNGENLESANWNYHTRGRKFNFEENTTTNKYLTHPFEKVPLTFSKSEGNMLVNSDLSDITLRIIYSHGEIDMDSSSNKNDTLIPFLPVVMKIEDGDRGGVVFDTNGCLAGVILAGDTNANRGLISNFDDISLLIKKLYTK